MDMTELKMTDQMERDLIEAEMMKGLANRNDTFVTEEFKVAAVVMGLMLFAATLLIWLGR